MTQAFPPGTDLARALLLKALRQGLSAADPARVVPQSLPPRPFGRVIVLAAGKAAAGMAAAVEAAWGPPLSGLVVTRDHFGEPLAHLPLCYASHPVPDARGQEAARRTLELAEAAGPEDTVLVLLSGGASALWPAPAQGLPLAEKQRVTTALLRAGATIEEINTVRRHLSLIKGGGLARAVFPARLFTLAISDVAGDDPAVIASGPTVGDPTTVMDARAILAKYRVPMPARGFTETVKPDDICLAQTSCQVVASGATALAAAAPVLAAAGYEPVMLGDRVTGEARQVAADHAALALKLQAEGKRAAILSGGELTVTVTGRGQGGPNQEYGLALALALKGAPGIHALAADTDGIDGLGEAAGALIDPMTLARLHHRGLDGQALLDENDAGRALAAAGSLLITGPTGTNVNDLRIILVDRA